jgi:hypothetical protein
MYGGRWKVKEGWGLRVNGKEEGRKQLEMVRSYTAGDRIQ